MWLKGLRVLRTQRAEYCGNVFNQSSVSFSCTSHLNLLPNDDTPPNYRSFCSLPRGRRFPPSKASHERHRQRKEQSALEHEQKLTSPRVWQHLPESVVPNQKIYQLIAHRQRILSNMHNQHTNPDGTDQDGSVPDYGHGEGSASFPLNDQANGMEGYFLREDSKNQLLEEYRQGQSLDLPHDSVTELNFEPQSDEEESAVDSDNLENVKYRFYRKSGSVNPVEHIELMQPPPVRQLYEDKFASNKDDESIDATIAPSKRQCPACAAQLHCQDVSLPGFLPVRAFKQMERNDENQICRRCYLLKHHNFLLNVNVTDVQYEEMISKLRLIDNALLLLVVDLVSMPSCIHRTLPKILASSERMKKPMIVVGNKLDLIPPDAEQGYLQRMRGVLEHTVRYMDFNKSFNILDTVLISARTGYGVEHLINVIQSSFGERGDLYLMGCTNVGKSTLFNTLLASDLCKTNSKDLIERACVSVWPGTTINLLKFPILKKSAIRVKLRTSRLERDQRDLTTEQAHRHMIAKVSVGECKPNEMLMSYVGNTHTTSYPSGSRMLVPGSQEYAASTWCYDTPGTAAHEQILDQLTLSELVHCVPRKTLQPRVAALYPGDALFIGGMARVEYPKHRTTFKEIRSAKHVSMLGDCVYCTVFVSEHLPLHVTQIHMVDEAYLHHANTGWLKAPSHSPARMAKFPSMEYRQFEVEPAKEEDRASLDVTLSSLGWLSLTSTLRSVSYLRVFSAGGEGLHARPPLLPYAVQLRGKRMGLSKLYRVRPMHTR